MAVTVFTPVDWSRIEYYDPNDFSHPEKLDHSVVFGLDRLAWALGKPAVILSDWRLTSRFTGSLHPVGRAIDFTYPDLDSMRVLTVIGNTRLFGGYGMYRNEAGAVSFHVDTRMARSPDDPATWGAYKEPGQTEWTYTSLQNIIKAVGPYTIPLVWIVLMSVGIYFLAKKQ